MRPMTIPSGPMTSYRYRLERRRDPLELVGVRGRSSSPILFCFALPGRRCRVLHLEPIGRAAGAVDRAKPLRHNALKAKLEGVRNTTSPGSAMCSVNCKPRAASCVDGPRLARENVACRTEVACSHVSGLFTQSGWTAGPDGVREPRPHHSSGIDVPMKRQVSLGCVGSTDCAITRHYSLASSSTGAVAY
jgi:hypothetical protein